jgi:Ca2+-binding RTX toxin-like protein
VEKKVTVKKGSIGNDNMTGSANLDRLFGDFGNDTIKALAGDDFVFGGGGKDVLSGGAGDDQVSGGLSSDRIFGDDGNDFLRGGGGFRASETDDGASDFIDGGAGNDYVFAGRLDTALGGSGVDTYSFYSNAIVPIKMNLSHIGGAKAVAIGSGTLSSTKAGQFESADISITGAKGGSSVIGSNGSDTIAIDVEGTQTKGVSISGGLGDDTLTGGTKADSINGGAGQDVITGGFEKDTLIGGAGGDVFVFGYQEIAATADKADLIRDFSAAEDMIVFYHTSFATTFQFGSQANLLAIGTAATAAVGISQFVYNKATGVLSLDTNGVAAGGVAFIADLTDSAGHNPLLTAHNIAVEALMF